MNLIESIKKHEGWRDTIYYDSEGVPTIGWGFNLTQPMPKTVAELWLAIKIEDHQKELRKFYWYNDLDEIRKDAFLEMHYNLGDARFCGFKKMIKALRNKKYNEAAREMLDSHWAEQVGRRANELAAIVAEDDNIGI